MTSETDDRKPVDDLQSRLFEHPLWLFCDDVEELEKILARLGEVEIFTSKGRVDQWEHIIEQRPLEWVCMAVQSKNISVTIYPKHVDLKSREWDPARTEKDITVEVEAFVKEKKHLFSFLGRRGWQVVVLFATLGLCTPAVILYLQGSPNNNPFLKLAAIIGLITAAITATLAGLGCFIPSRSKLTLSRLTRPEFMRCVWKVVKYIVGVIVIFLIGYVIGRQ